MKLPKLLVAVLFGSAIFSSVYAVDETEMLEEKIMLDKRKEKCAKNACDPFEILQLINIVSPQKFDEIKDKNLSTEELLKIADDLINKK